MLRDTSRLKITAMWHGAWKSETHENDSFPHRSFSVTNRKLSLSAESIKLYHLHATLLNLSENVRYRAVTQGHSVVAYFTVTYQRPDEENEKRCDHTTKLSKLKVVAALHDSIERALHPVHDAADVGVLHETGNDVSLKCHIRLC